MTYLLALYLRLIAYIIKVALHRVTGIELPSTTKAEVSIDERILKLDAARQNLVDGIEALDQLKSEADRNKKELRSAIEQVSLIQQDKEVLSKELEDVQAIMQNDVKAFQNLAGIPSSDEIFKERIIGFISGVIASMIASAIWFFAGEIYKKLQPVQQESVQSSHQILHP